MHIRGWSRKGVDYDPNNKTRLRNEHTVIFIYIFRSYSSGSLLEKKNSFPRSTCSVHWNLRRPLSLPFSLPFTILPVNKPNEFPLIFIEPCYVFSVLETRLIATRLGRDTTVSRLWFVFFSKVEGTGHEGTRASLTYFPPWLYVEREKKREKGERKQASMSSFSAVEFLARQPSQRDRDRAGAHFARPPFWWTAL